MASAWGAAWGNAWGNAWGLLTTGEVVENTTRGSSGGGGGGRRIYPYLAPEYRYAQQTQKTRELAKTKLKQDDEVLMSVITQFIKEFG